LVATLVDRCVSRAAEENTGGAQLVNCLPLDRGVGKDASLMIFDSDRTPKHPRDGVRERKKLILLRGHRMERLRIFTQGAGDEGIELPPASVFSEHHRTQAER